MIGAGRLVSSCAGPTCWTDPENSVGKDDLAAQVEQCYLNVAVALASSGGSFDDVVKLTVFVVDWSPDKIESLVAGVSRAAERLGIAVPMAPLTGMGVAAL